MYILDLSMTLTFDLYVGGGGILSEFYSQFLSCSDLVKVYELLFLFLLQSVCYINGSLI